MSCQEWSAQYYCYDPDCWPLISAQSTECPVQYEVSCPPPSLLPPQERTDQPQDQSWRAGSGPGERTHHQTSLIRRPEFRFSPPRTTEPGSQRLLSASTSPPPGPRVSRPSPSRPCWGGRWRDSRAVPLWGWGLREVGLWTGTTLSTMRKSWPWPGPGYL